MRVNQLKAGVILSYVSIVLTNLISIIYTPIMLRILGQSEYGLYQLANSVVSYLGLLSFGFGSAYIKFYSEYKKSDDQEGIAKLNGMFMICFLGMSVLALLFGGILVANVENIFSGSLTAQELATTKILMTVMVFNIALMFPNSVFNANVTAHEKYIFQKVISLASSVLNPMLVLILLFLGFKSIGLVIAATIIAVLKLTVDMYYCLRKLKIRFVFRGFDFRLLKDIAIFSSFIFINTITDLLNFSVDKFILGMVKGTTTVAIYSVGASLNHYYISFSTAISNVFIPRVNRLVAECESDKTITDLFIKIGRIQFVVIGLIISGFVLFGRQFIAIWAGDGYENAYYVALAIMIPTTVPIIQNISIEIQRAKNLHKFRSVVYLMIALCNLFVSIPLAIYFGEIGSAVGTGVSILIGNIIIMNIYNHVKVRLNIIEFFKNILRMAIPIIILATVFFFVLKYVDIQGILSLFIAIVVYSLLYFAAMWLFGFNKYEKNLVKSVFKRKNKKLS